jgi:hypothetical protein
MAVTEAARRPGARAARAGLAALAIYGVLVFLDGRAERGIVCVWLAALLAGPLGRAAAAATEGGRAALAERLRAAAALARARPERGRGETRAQREAAPATDAVALAWRYQTWIATAAWVEGGLAAGFGAPLGAAAVFTGAVVANVAGLVYRRAGALASGKVRPRWSAYTYFAATIGAFLGLISRAVDPADRGVALLLGFHILFALPALLVALVQRRLALARSSGDVALAAPLWPLVVAALAAALEVLLALA